MRAVRGLFSTWLCAGLVFTACSSSAQPGPGLDSSDRIAASSTATDGIESTPAELLVGSRTDYFSCSVGRFRGELEARVVFASAGNTAYFDVSAVRYRIVRSDGQGGGNKANINFHLDTLNRQGVVRGSDAYHSPDSLKQDGSWHMLDINRIVRTDYQGAVTFEFVFDRSKAADTRCAAHKTYQWAGPSAGLSTASE
ncbi:hypothetical protein CCU68_30440 [Pseudomonas gingeri NCPPB 3146 = LMG 5327]|uniref:Lipoprotein n=2 Tax=Pseudomonas gingeri TaxID=117681 RepID=A0A7Y8CB48_9PSED|nr:MULTISPECIES: hypothetical protein [Pseudomonas]NVZ28305.1 hypothetical protein [Pseudomonas gingeri]NVZ61916.1 hypothetical protein [Pseudomonas gingeri]NVZ79499.1 hypothetical protein [Pseudomonas gingeri]NWA09180.1 hypothetical protein [Pseudomonas gingeri]NWC12253.1 hypothetical protein [Pseudomonas gingeri]